MVLSKNYLLLATSFLERSGATHGRSPHKAREKYMGRMKISTPNPAAAPKATTESSAPMTPVDIEAPRPSLAPGSASGRITMFRLSLSLNLYLTSLPLLLYLPPSLTTPRLLPPVTTSLISSLL